MGGFAAHWQDSDGVSRLVALLLLAMSVASWVLIVWRGRALARAQADLGRAGPAFWEADSLDQGRARLAAADREGLLLPLLEARLAPAAGRGLDTGLPPVEARTRRLREALQGGLSRLQAGQVVLASVGATAPFVGLLGTVWEVYQALADLGASGAPGLDAVAGPVGEALVMTAAGLAVAIPAVLAYNALGRRVAELEAALEGWAHDLLAWEPAPPAR